MGCTDTQTDMLQGEPYSATCVQRVDDTLNCAIHFTYRSLLRSSSMHEPRDPPLKVVILLEEEASCLKFGFGMQPEQSQANMPSG